MPDLNPACDRRASAGAVSARGQDIGLTVMLAVQFTALFVAAPFAATGHPAMRSVTDMLVVAYVLLVTLVSPDRTTRMIAIVVGILGVGGVLGRIAAPSPSTILVAHILAVVGFVVTGYVVARALIAPGPINTHRVLGAIVFYLNLALAFSTTYRLVWDLAPDAFTGIPDGAEGPRGFAAIIYFSFVTLTSTGYGDILPIHPAARSLSNLESVIGQLYPATVLAALVARHVEWRARQSNRN